MDASNSTPTGNDQNPAQNLTAAQQPIAHQVAQQNSGSSNGVPQQPLASNSPAPLNNANIGSNNGAQNGALNGSATGGLQCEWIGCGQRAGTAEQLYVRELSLPTPLLQLKREDLVAMPLPRNRSRTETSHVIADFLSLGACMRGPCRSSLNQQPQLAMCLGQLPYCYSQTRSHYFAHSGARSTKTSRLSCLLKEVQASTGLEKTRKDSCR